MRYPICTFSLEKQARFFSQSSRFTQSWFFPSSIFFHVICFCYVSFRWVFLRCHVTDGIFVFSCFLNLNFVWTQKLIKILWKVIFNYKSTYMLTWHKQIIKLIFLTGTAIYFAQVCQIQILQTNIFKIKYRLQRKLYASLEVFKK